jgi:tRNA threonylcarbamoyladenosine biosynthesis protein TsaB
MLILSIRTDNPEAEIGLYDDTRRMAYVTWTAHRQLAETLHTKIQELMQTQNKTIHDIQAIACYAGPGSFTGLRIGLTVANTLAYALRAPIAAESGDGWLERATERLKTGDSDPLALPEYGADVHITPPRS